MKNAELEQLITEKARELYNLIDDARLTDFNNMHSKMMMKNGLDAVFIGLSLEDENE